VTASLLIMRAVHWAFAAVSARLWSASVKVRIGRICGRKLARLEF
jgi:hypothetical protein